jgi:hypothetical protein
MLGKKTVALYLAAVFAAGLLAGAAAGFCFGKRQISKPLRPHDMETHLCDKLKSKLQLTPEQEKQIRPFVCEAAEEIESIFSETGERMTDVFRKLNERQAQFLTLEQKVLLEEMEQERRKLFQREPKSNTVQHPPAASPARIAE